MLLLLSGGDEVATVEGGEPVFITRPIRFRPGAPDRDPPADTEDEEAFALGLL